MIRGAALASGDGALLQAILDSMYFNEIPDFELVAVICPQRECYAMKRALNAGVPAYVVDPELYPAFEDLEGDLCQAVIERGVKVTGATAYFADGDGSVGGIILQKALEVLPEDDAESLRQRVLEDCEWKLLSEAVALYCSGKLSIDGMCVRIGK